MLVALEFSPYEVDVIYVPSLIGNNIKKIQNRFYKWLFDKSNNHGYWVIIDGKKRAVSFGSDAFVRYINEYHLMESQEKAYIAEQELDSVPDTCEVTLFF